MQHIHMQTLSSVKSQHKVPNMYRQLLENKNKSLMMTPIVFATAARELEELKQQEMSRESSRRYAHVDAGQSSFPPACLCLLRSIPGNSFCADCGAPDPQWATRTYGALVCLKCSGKHRRLGVQLSVVRSLTMDSWSHKGILSMLEGGNKQLNDFFDRHGLSGSHAADNCINQGHGHGLGHGQRYGNFIVNRYQTNAARFYKKNLSIHVQHVKELGEYKGRDWSRRRTKRKNMRHVANNTTSSPSAQKDQDHKVTRNSHFLKAH